MTIDLTTAAVRPTTGPGMAARTAAGFIVLGSADSTELMSFIEQRQSQADLIEQLAGRISESNPETIAMLFTAGGEPFLLAWGQAVATITSGPTRFTVTPVGGELLVHPLALADDATVLLSNGMPGDNPQPSPINLAKGSMPASAVVIDLSGAAPPASRPASLPVADTAPSEAGDGRAPSPGPAEVLDPAVSGATAEAIDAATTIDAVTPVGDPGDEVDDTATATTPMVTASQGALGQPAAQEIVFAEDLAEIDDLLEAPAQSFANLISVTAAGAEVPPEFRPEPPGVTASIAAAADTEAGDPVRITTPLPGRTGPYARRPIGPVMVLGISCPSGHHNHPDAEFCSQCGTRMGIHQTSVLLNGPRPPLGVLISDDGTSFSLDHDLVIGRDPAADPDVRAGYALPALLPDDTLSLSRRHARVSLADWAVLITDLGSSNGTWLSRGPDPADWTQVGAETAVSLRSGDRLRLGGRLMSVELHH